MRRSEEVGKGEIAMVGLPQRTRKVRPSRMSAKDRKFEDLLRRAADFLKSRPSPEAKRSEKND